MKNIFLSLFLAGPASAASTSLPAALGAASGLAKETSARLASKTNTLAVNACYERVDNAEADRLGLPKRLCLETLSITMPERDPYPLSYDAYLSATGTPAAPRMHISGAAREADGWELVGSWLSLWSAKEPVCGRLNSAHASVYVKSSLDGTLKDAPVTVRAFLMDGSALCRTSAPAVHFDYTRL
ncbi:hypothetical protein EPO15_01385 [bacterium]|nr:MAG: hypothetical protein EPO15_01385 [bacterium]